MKFVVPLALVAGALAGSCDFTTCNDCMASAVCGWYKASVDGTVIEGDLFSGCKVISDVTSNDVLAATVTKQDTCPPCQAGACDKCFANPTGNCQWFEGPLGIGSNCAVEADTAPLTHTKKTTCPVCPSTATCANCEETAGCRWYADFLGLLGECADAEPFAKGLVVKEACAGNKCLAGSDCTECTAIDVGGVKPCAWLEPKDFYAPFRQAKCDLLSPGDIDEALFDILTGTCPVCSGNTCSSCQAEAGCTYTAAVVLGAYGFGKCIVEASEIPFGKEIITTCRDECEIYSCTECNANAKCAWYAQAGVYNAGCDLVDNPKVLTHIGQSPITTCPKCSFSRCYNCREESPVDDGCKWYVNTYPWGDAVEDSGDCEAAGYSTVVLEVEMEPTRDDFDKLCPVEVSGANLLAPALALAVLALF